MKRTILVATVALAGLSVTTVASAEYLPKGESQKSQVDSVEMMVDYMKSDAFIPSRLELRQISSDVVADLVEIAESSRSEKVRGRAIQSLALYRSDQRTVKTLSSLMNDMRPGDELFPAVLVSYAQTLGEKAVDKIDEYARHGREDVRMAAVVALGRYGGNAGMRILAEVAESEDHPVIQKRINRYLN